jgi:sodium/bile acid cotransporter 7
LPLIGAIYGNNPAVGLYTLPLIIWHPLQLIFGTALVPKLVAFVERENERLGIKSDEDDKPSSDLESADRLVENSNCSTEKQEVFSESETDN